MLKVMQYADQLHQDIAIRNMIRQECGQGGRFAGGS